MVPVLLPQGVKDPADLARLPGGDTLFLAAMRRAVAHA
jgi:hypothetical protein